jgi:hypothetical protein
MPLEQIARGADHDVFLAANERFVDGLAQNKAVIIDSKSSMPRGRIGLYSRKFLEWKDLCSRSDRRGRKPSAWGLRPNRRLRMSASGRIFKKEHFLGERSASSAICRNRKHRRRNSCVIFSQGKGGLALFPRTAPTGCPEWCDSQLTGLIGAPILQLPAFGRWSAASDSIRLFARASNSSNPTFFACTIKRFGAEPT